MTDDADAVPVREPEVEEDDVRTIRVPCAEARAGVTSLLHVVAVDGEVVRHARPRDRVVLDDQDPRAGHSGWSPVAAGSRIAMQRPPSSPLPAPIVPPMASTKPL